MAVDIDKLVDDAHELVRLKTPWVHQGRDPVHGIDCLNFIIYLLIKQGYVKTVNLTPYSQTPNGRHMYRVLKNFVDEIPVEEARKGDVYQINVRNNPQHLVLRVSDTEPALIVHAERPNFNRVIESTLNDDYASRIFAVWRFRDSIPEEVTV